MTPEERDKIWEALVLAVVWVIVMAAALATLGVVGWMDSGPIGSLLEMAKVVAIGLPIWAAIYFANRFARRRR